ncbi:cupin domain-containing protein [Pelagibacteraceae bacterium]|nr:cupin domain-containing protein [Pelagibacteraceae bacterium]
MNGTLIKNELIFDFASGALGVSKSIFASTYLFLNAKASNLNSTFEGVLGDSLLENNDTPVSKFKYTDCITDKKQPQKQVSNQFGPLSKIIGPLDKIEWKQVFKGFNEFNPNVFGDDELKLIKMDPGASVPLHSHGGKEYILVLDGSFCDEYGKYSKGDIQINDQKIRHTPIASQKEGCICLTITEKDVIFFWEVWFVPQLIYFYSLFF